MNDAELEALLKALESDRVERKSSLADGERIREAVTPSFIHITLRKA